MILIVDCGSTKSEWVMADSSALVAKVVTSGFNPNFTASDTISAIICKTRDALSSIGNADKIFFYGSGCGSDDNRLMVRSLLESAFSTHDVSVFPDILASCHALFTDSPGVACILGTGSNACLYDGRNIVHNAESLGFILGDEGSGCHIGKKIARDYFYGIMPDDLRMKFLAEYHVCRDSFLKNVYHNDAPSKYLASFALFAKENISHYYIRCVIGQCFDEFFDCMVKPLASDLPVGFVGSVAHGFSEILSDKASEHGLSLVKIIKSPTEELVKYYQRLLFCD
ncbi:MAG: hypothetical protein ACI358_01070 [Candidatus Limimorpha sp.]